MAINVIQGIAVVAAISYVDIVCEPSWQEINVEATVSFPDVLAVEVINPVDSIALNFSTGRSDSILVGDLTFKTTTKGLTDTATPFDVFRKNVSKVLSDNVSLTDNIVLTLVFIRSFSETVQIIESPALSFVNGPISDTATPQDLAAKTISKSFADSITVTDALTFSISLALAENPTLADSFTYVVEKEKLLDDGSSVGDAYVFRAFPELWALCLRLIFNNESRASCGVEALINNIHKNIFFVYQICNIYLPHN